MSRILDGPSPQRQFQEPSEVRSCRCCLSGDHRRNNGSGCHRVFPVLWRGRTTADQSRIAVVSGLALAAWAIGTATLARRGYFELRDAHGPPPVGIALGAALAVLAVRLLLSASLRALLVNQRHLILLNVWRLVGAVFRMVMAAGQMPALWALPAGIGT